MTIQTLTIAAALGIAGLSGMQLQTPAHLTDPSANPLVQPTPAVSQQTLEQGKAMFDISCAPCHGTDGKGDGPIASNLRTQPRDFTRGIYLNRSTASGELPTDYDIYHSITTGLHNTPMPSFAQMRPEDRWAIVQYIKTFSPRFSDSTEYPLDVLNVGVEIHSSPQGLARGRAIYVQLQCSKCHGTNGQADGPAANTLVDDFGNHIRPTDLTNPSSYKFAHNVVDVFRIFSTGLNGTPMPSFAQSVSDTDRWNLANYVWALQNTDQYMDNQ